MADERGEESVEGDEALAAFVSFRAPDVVMGLVTEITAWAAQTTGCSGSLESWQQHRDQVARMALKAARDSQDHLDEVNKALEGKT